MADANRNTNNRKEPVTPRGGATRTAILENAARLFAEKGYEGTSLRDIGEAMNLTRQSVYHYFHSKEELLSTLVAETSEIAADKLRSIRQDDTLDATEKLARVTTALVVDRMEFSERFRMLERSESSLPEPVAGKHLAARRAVLSEVRAVLAEGIEAGQFRECDDRLGALSLLGMCNWIAYWYHPGLSDSPDEVIGSFVETARVMFANPEPGAPEPGTRGALARVRRDLDRLDRIIHGPDLP
ncbi:TetR/AcrR family transcriptional regulator [Amycolatopsis rhabdoformis]|uniref:TetR/AcrR family transcriptional regulator n=1 Tax=Amycolatopsis rhabdoformis TaxID=1448059 RepID=A0ABZ1ILW0_9PSEU|nr:TetR/AcrR family transcriptional regulator [Amycolatopsis rhabdoformis]WSE34712.1 TetR/AcrR family transcriptional regulator [Amycolatopsis rhabdoformis]